MATREGTMHGFPVKWIVIGLAVIAAVAALFFWLGQKDTIKLTSADRAITEKIDAGTLTSDDLEAAAKENKLPYKKMPGEAAFYGPKLDFIFKDSLQREWQLATIQLDFNLPNRFELHYMNEKGEKEQPVMIHRAISGSLERFLSILIEHFAGKFPLWLSPVQVKILTVTDRSNEFAKQVYNKLKQKDIRVELNDAAETIGKKIRDAQLEQVNYIVTIGDKEIEKKVLAVRTRTGEVTFDVKVDDFISQLEKEIKGKVIS